MKISEMSINMNINPKYIANIYIKIHILIIVANDMPAIRRLGFACRMLFQMPGKREGDLQAVSLRER
jgi:hypothetical protein